MPRDDNAAVMAAEAIRRLAVPGEPRVTPVMRRLLDELAASLPPDAAALARAIGDDDPRRSDAALRALCDEAYARALRALIRDSISPDVIHSGFKYNVIRALPRSRSTAARSPVPPRATCARRS